MTKKTKISPEEAAEFEAAMKGTRRYQHEKVTLDQRHPKIDKKPRRLAHNETQATLSSDLNLPTVSAEEKLRYKHSSISEKILRKLSKGQYNVDATLDLHGLNVEQAKVEVLEFVQACIKHQARVAVIIHGKGTHGYAPILKNMINQWLRQLDNVLAFCSATAAHGSRGAVYVLIRDMSDGDELGQ